MVAAYGILFLVSFLYRHALFVSRKQPYIAWANNVDDSGVRLDDDLNRQQRTVYLVDEIDGEPKLADLLDDWWMEIFEQELTAWHIARADWPQELTREMFDAWFDVELCASVYDLDPDAPLTQYQVDVENLADAMAFCAACGMELERDEGQLTGFKVADPQRLDLFRGRVLPLEVDEGVIDCLVPPDDIDIGEDGDDLFVRVCSAKCEKVVRKVVPKALRRYLARLPADA